MDKLDQQVREHGQLTRRYFLQLGGAAVAAWSVSPLAAADAVTDPQLQEAISKLEYLTPLDRASILDKGKAGVVKLPIEQLREIGLIPDTWSLDVIPDPASNSVVEQPLSRALGNALNWQGLMSLAHKHAVRFMQVCTLRQVAATRPFDPACVRAVMIYAAVPSMAMASLNPCPARCQEPVSTPFTWST
jgi:hypothetical protein